MERFGYDAARDLYVCPQGRELPRKSDSARSSGRYRAYYDSRGCRGCPVRRACTRGADGKLTVHEHQKVIDAAQARLRQRPEICKQRHALVEHPFGTLKFWLGYRAFLCRGVEMVRATACKVPGNRR